jgi:hypothetical protein
VREDDPYADAAAVSWPSAVFLAATAVDGPTSLPLPPQLWADAVLIRCDADASGGASAAATGARGTERGVPSVVIAGHRDVADRRELTTDSDLLRLAGPGDAGVSDAFDALSQDEARPEELLSLRPVATRYAQALGKFFSGSDDVRRELLRSCFAPTIASIVDNDRRDELLRALERTIGTQVDAERYVLDARRCVA